MAAQFGRIKLWTAIAATLVQLSVPSNVFADGKPLRQIEDKAFEVIDIGLSPWPRSKWIDYEPSFYGFWLSNTQLVMSVLQDVPDAYARKLERIVLIDTVTGAWRVLIEQGHVNCRSRKSQVMAYLPFEPSYYRNNPDRKIPDDYRFVQLDDEGRVSPLKGPSPIERNCAPAGSVVGAPNTGKALREDDGYIDLSAHDDKENLTLGTAKLVRPGKPLVELGIPNAAVSWPIYLPYYDKYLMSAWDYSKGSGTARKHSGGYWKYPYDYSPYWLVSREGKVESIPYPEVIFEYGVNEFQYLWPTPRGLLINDPEGLYAGKGLLLLQGDRLLRIWGGPLSLNFLKDNRGRGEVSYVLNISPDGCRVVFTHARNYPLAKDKNPDPIPLSILNICKDR